MNQAHLGSSLLHGLEVDVTIDLGLIREGGSQVLSLLDEV